MVIETAKGFILLNTHMKLVSSWSEDSHKVYPFWYNLAMPTATENISTNQTTVSLETAPNPMSKTLLYFSRMKCPITYKKNCCLEFATIC